MTAPFLMFQIRLLGPIEITRDGAPLRAFETRKAYALLAYLIRRAQPIPRAQLAELLWSNFSEARGRRNLSHALTLLSNALPACIAADYHALQFKPSDEYWVDVVEFQELIADHRRQTSDDVVRRRESPAILASAVALYRGEFLAGLFFDDCPDFETWLLREQEFWRAQVTHTLERLVRTHGAEKQFADAQRVLQRWLEIEPWSEDAHRYLMRVFAAQGERRAAVAQFERAQKILGQELNAAPLPETIALYQQIRDGEYDPDAAQWRQTHASPVIEISRRAPRHNLPAPISRFIGRTRELAELPLLLEKYRLVTLTGAGGSGKTRLAVTVGEGLLGGGVLAGRDDSVNRLPSPRGGDVSPKRLYGDGVWLVEFAPITEPALVLNAVAEIFGVRESAGVSLERALTAYLAPKEIVLIFDNCEHLIDACAAAADFLLRACPALKIVATSREPLRVLGEKIFPVPPFGLPASNVSLTPDALMQYDAIRFFVERAEAVAEFALTQENAAAVVQICRQLDGMPLALELAAARVNVLPVAEIAARLNDRFNLLTSGNRAALPRHQTLRALVDWSYQLLSEPERALFRALSVFAGGWTVKGAEEIAKDEGGRMKDEAMNTSRFIPHPSSLTFPSSLTNRWRGWSRRKRWGLRRAITCSRRCANMGARNCARRARNMRRGRGI